MMPLGTLLLVLALIVVDPVAGTYTLRDSVVTGDGAATMRVVTYNIAAARDGSLQEIAETILALDADVIALQEVASNWADDTGFDDQAAVLGEMLNMEVFYAPIYSLPGRDGSMREFGLAVLSRHSFDRAINHPITRHSTQDEGRIAPLPGFPEVVITLNGIEVRIFNTHLDYRRDPAVRQDQISEMLTIMGDVSSPTLLVGDLTAC